MDLYYPHSNSIIIFNIIKQECTQLVFKLSSTLFDYNRNRRTHTTLWWLHAKKYWRRSSYWVHPFFSLLLMRIDFSVQISKIKSIFCQSFVIMLWHGGCVKKKLDKNLHNIEDMSENSLFGFLVQCSNICCTSNTMLPLIMQTHRPTITL